MTPADIRTVTSLMSNESLRAYSDRRGALGYYARHELIRRDLDAGLSVETDDAYYSRYRRSDGKIVTVAVPKK